MTEHFIEYLIVFAGPLVLTLILTPIVREINRKLGMVDKPDPRRINKVPIPRGGGVALFLGVELFFVGYALLCPEHSLMSVNQTHYWRIAVLAAAITAIGLADDRWSLQPRVKLLGQIVVAALTWWWAGLGFSDLWPNLPMWVDGVLTVFWIIGAVNAFNLIDGLDGLASGLALIASLGMAGALIFAGHPNLTFFYFALAGGLMGFLRYNYNPASVFLGDSGSMYIGYTLSVLPLASHAENSFLVSVGVPLLAMGVPIFDTFLAILRRSVRRLLNAGDPAPDGKVMNADSDHLHHRILRSVGLSQRKAAWVLYAMALFAVAVGLVGMNFESRRAGLWLIAVTVATVVIFRDASRIEIFDAGRLLNRLAHDRRTSARRRIARVYVPFYVACDVLSLAFAYLLVLWVTQKEISRPALMLALPVSVLSTFVCLVCFRVYRTIWSRAMLSNYLHLLMACVLGSIVGTLGVYYAPTVSVPHIRVTLPLFALLSYLFLVGSRVVRAIVRDTFYAIDCAVLKGRKDVSRILVYGSGLRYRSFRRELVRQTTNNTRIIVGLLDDDLLLRGCYIGGIRVLGTLGEAPSVINRVNADAVVVACEITPAWRKVVLDTLRPTGVKVSFFSFSEQPADEDQS